MNVLLKDNFEDLTIRSLRRNGTQDTDDSYSKKFDHHFNRIKSHNYAGELLEGLKGVCFRSMQSICTTAPVINDYIPSKIS